jgi:hypothetical protein
MASQPIMQITIRSLKDRNNFTVEVKHGDTVDELKGAIAAQTGTSPDAMRLVFGGRTLPDGAELRALGVQKGATVHLVLRLKTHVELRVRVMSGKTVDLNADPRAEVERVLGDISDLLNLDARRPRVLCTTGEPLDAGGRLDQFGRLADGALLHLVLLPTPHQPSLYAHLGDGSENDRARAYGFPGSLYERCGGVFGVAAFVDRCMDAWMADPILNANDAVATWHERAQRCGFKFLVTQLMGYLCGGPQIVSCSKGVWLRVCIGCVNWCVD